MSETRFAFGRNWQRFAKTLNDERIAVAEASLKTMLGVQDLRGKTFLDIGSGSGLFSLAAIRLGASRVRSFDYDNDSVACTSMLKSRYASEAGGWTIEQGSALDPAYMASLGSFDVVYSWGVLHHTGAMWTGIAHAMERVAAGGTLFIAIYNDQGFRSRIWWQVKRAYVRVPPLRPVIVGVYAPYFAFRGAVADVLIKRTNPLTRYVRPAGIRGMVFWTDLIDWLGGFPFEVATVDALFDACHARGFDLQRLTTTGGALGCNELVFVKRPAPSA